MKDEDFLLAEYKFLTDCFWKNADVGEKRVSFFITLSTAIIAGVIALVTSQHTSVSRADVRLIATGVLLGTFLLGLVTFRRMVHRNRVTDEYKDVIGYVREQMRRRSPSLSEYHLPWRSHRPLFRGGLAETMALMNSLIAGVIMALWAGWPSGVLVFLSACAGQIAYLSTARPSRAGRAQTFRAGVGAIICNARGLVLGLERKNPPGAWQAAQGGLEEGEEPEEAVKREILEETGIRESDLILLSTEPRLLAYELSKEHRSEKTGRGQVHRWYLFRYTGDDEGITLGDRTEFTASKWLPMNELVSKVVSFKRPVYQELAAYFSSQLAGSAQVQDATSPPPPADDCHTPSG